MIGILHNSCYTVLCIVWNKTVYGILLRAEGSSAYHKWDLIEWPLYHLKEDKKQQFNIGLYDEERQYRDKKISICN